MASQDSSQFVSRSPNRISYGKARHLVLQDDTPPTYSPSGQGTFANLIRTRSQCQNPTPQHYAPARRAAGGLESGPDLEAGAVLDVTSPATLPHGLVSPYAIVSDDDDAMSSRRSVAEERRLSAILRSHPVRSMRLIGNSNPRYRWEQYWKTEEELEALRPKIRSYYERTNYLVQQYLYIDRLLDSSLPHDLLNEYNDMPASHFRGVEIPDTIREEPPSGARSPHDSLADSSAGSSGDATLNNPPHSAATSSGQSSGSRKKVKRTPRDIYRATETTPLFSHGEEDGDEAVAEEARPDIPWLDEDDVDSGDRIVRLAIYVNFAANLILLAGKLLVVLSVPSMSVLAGLVDAVLDFLSTAIVWLTTWLISRQDQYQYPVGRRRLEPLGVLMFSIIMITTFVQVGLESTQRLMSPNHELVELGASAIIIMASTIVIKSLCWLWCRMVKNSSVQALAADAMTDVIFNTGSILFPIIGFYARIWWLDALGGLLLSLIVIVNWSGTSLQHIKNLSGFSATADQRNVLLYLTMRFAKTIRQIQGLQAYHAGDKLNVEVDIVLDASTSLRDSHDLAESLQYVLESVPIVDRAFVHTDYATYNLPTHMAQQS